MDASGGRCSCEFTHSVAWGGNFTDTHAHNILLRGLTLKTKQIFNSQKICGLNFHISWALNNKIINITNTPKKLGAPWKCLVYIIAPFLLARKFKCGCSFKINFNVSYLAYILLIIIILQ